MDNDRLEDPQNPASLTGLEPIIDQTTRSVIEQHVASAVRKALTGRLDTSQLEGLATQAAERALGELADPPEGLYYQTVQQWVEEWLLPVYRRSVQGHERTWCPQWWRHPEAVARLESLWRAWEQLRQDPGTGLSVWFRDHADHHMTILLDADGPFKGCGEGKHSERPLPQLPNDPAPEGMFQPDQDPPAVSPIGPPAARAHHPTAGHGREPNLQRGR